MMYETINNVTELRLLLHTFVYNSNLNLLTDILQTNVSINDINVNTQENRIDILLDTKDLNIDMVKENIKRSFYLLLNNIVVNDILKQNLTEDQYQRYKYISCTLEMIEYLYNITNISVTQPNDTIILIL